MGGSLEQTTTEVEPELAEDDTPQRFQGVAFVNSQGVSPSGSTATVTPLSFGRVSEQQRRTTPSPVATPQAPARSALPQPTVVSHLQTTTVTAPTPPVVQPIVPPVPVQVARSIVAPPLPSNLDLPPLPNSDRFLPSLTTNFIWPARGVLTSGFGPRWGRMHRGIDIAAPVGTPIYAAAAGVVTYSQWNDGGYGNLVEIRHADGALTLYAHNQRNLVRVGQYVEQGQQIAEMGSTGRSTGPHLHFEVHLPGRGAVNPMLFLQRVQG
ncbi:MAG TPA: M23 family metallopeptidase [Thermosynechococcus sp. M46_R2017_013]|nr:M23 family metallopeptidase [Thermosynechococcus sp. M46_R2017_013]